MTIGAKYLISNVNMVDINYHIIFPNAFIHIEQIHIPIKTEHIQNQLFYLNFEYYDGFSNNDFVNNYF